MFQSSRSAHLLLRLGMAAVFVWFGVGSIIHPQDFMSWIPGRLMSMATAVGMSTANAVILLGIVELLVAASLVTGFFVAPFALLGAVIIALTLFMHGAPDTTARSIGLVAALVALALMPRRRYS